jgi:hypothetical protein
LVGDVGDLKVSGSASAERIAFSTAIGRFAIAKVVLGSLMATDVIKPLSNVTVLVLATSAADLRVIPSVRRGSIAMKTNSLLTVPPPEIVPFIGTTVRKQTEKEQDGATAAICQLPATGQLASTEIVAASGRTWVLTNSSMV